MTDLQMLHVSSNCLQKLPSSIVECTSLETIYANSNKLTTIPTGMAEALVLLKRLTLSHNDLQDLPQDFIERFGIEGDMDPTCVVTFTCNPVFVKNKNDSDVLMEE